MSSRACAVAFVNWLTRRVRPPGDLARMDTSIPKSHSAGEDQMSTSLVMRALFAATALAVAPAIASAQAPQSKSCKDGTSSTRSTFACWGHGGVDTASHAAERPRAGAEKHHAAEAVQAGTPRAHAAKSTAHKASKAKAHHAKVEHRDARAAKKKDEGHRGWLPWRHKKAKDDDAKKTKKHKSASRAPLTERPNGQPRQN